MKQLWVKAICGSSEDMGLQSRLVADAAPEWFLHGMTPISSLSEDDEHEDIYYAALWGEMEFIRWEQLECGVGWSEREISEEDMQRIYEEAARQALRIALMSANIADYGEVLLKKYPEAREASCDAEAYIQAALKERSACFSEEDYEEPYM